MHCDILQVVESRSRSGAAAAGRPPAPAAPPHRPGPPPGLKCFKSRGFENRMRLRRVATAPNAVAASSIGQLDPLTRQDSDEDEMADGGPGGSIPVQKNKASGPGKIPVSRNGPDTPRSSKKQCRAGELIVHEDQGGYFSSP